MAVVAREWISRDDWGVSVQLLQEFYVNAVRKPNGLSHDDALAMVEEIAGSRQVISLDVPLMRHALQLKSRYRIAYWEAAVNAGAHRLGASTLLSEDLAHGQHYGGVRVFNPFAGS
jgi:predicted nucleic acid-binding protein